jgi:hypothetical protein
MSAVHEEGLKGDDAIRILTADTRGSRPFGFIQRKSATSTRILKEIGTDYLDKIVRPVAR